ncbi:hypothetical protein PHYPSEUDO_003473 [Phytophthora pseudosyringae]|uniref:Uncharacterized protein n=1 Tax=Phytophthora pseudosyringae TaxID=221518 RepID=A0A8T1VUG8_9STRA|nr:hypothetical protein PHYPSEUDO_003473 [Phytophthora pseudosyringae]
MSECRLKPLKTGEDWQPVRLLQGTLRGAGHHQRSGLAWLGAFPVQLAVPDGSAYTSECYTTARRISRDSWGDARHGRAELLGPLGEARCRRPAQRVALDSARTGAPAASLHGKRHSNAKSALAALAAGMVSTQ